MQPLPLVGLTEIAERAGVQKAAVAMWVARHTPTLSAAAFPEPVATLRVGKVWWWPDIEGWLRRTGRTADADLSVAQVNRNATRHPPR